jgi:hypothetical protein
VKKHRTKPTGNPNPSPATRFGAGVSGNPIGKTSEQRQIEIRNAWLATTIQAQMLEAVAATLQNDPAAALSRIEPSTLKLLKDAQDRGLGTAKASVDVTNSDGSLTPEARQSVLLEILAKRHEA